MKHCHSGGAVKYLISISLLAVMLCLLATGYSLQEKSLETKRSGMKGEIVFSAYRNGSWQIQVIPSNRELIHTEGEMHYPSWSPDGKKIAYADNEGEIWITEKDKVPHRIEGVSGHCNHPDWSPDGNKIAFVCYYFTNRRENSDIWIADLKQNKTWKLAEQDGIQSYPAWSPDGTIISYTTGYRVSSDKIIEELWLANSDGTNQRPLISNDSSNIQPDWSPDGKRIAFASDKGGNMDIWVIDKDGGNLKRLTHERSYDADPGWSPDGTKICFTSTRSGKMDIWIMDSNGENPEQLTGVSASKAESKEPDWTN